MSIITRIHRSGQGSCSLEGLTHLDSLFIQSGESFYWQQQGAGRVYVMSAHQASDHISDADRNRWLAALNAAKEGESRKDVRVYWILFHICCWILLVVSLKMDWPEWCMGVLIFAILIWFPLKRPGSSLSVEQTR